MKKLVHIFKKIFVNQGDVRFSFSLSLLSTMKFQKKVHIRCASQPQEFFFVLFSVAILGGHHEEANTKTRHKGIGKVVVSNMFYFHHYLGKWSNLTNIFQLGWNHHLVSYLVTVQYNSMFFAPLERCKAWAIYDGNLWCVILAVEKPGVMALLRWAGTGGRPMNISPLQA